MIDGIAVVFGNTAKFFDKVVIIDDLLFITAVNHNANLPFAVGVSTDDFCCSAV